MYIYMHMYVTEVLVLHGYMHNAARRRHVGGVCYTIHFEIVGFVWEKGMKSGFQFPSFADIPWKVEMKAGGREPFHAVLPSSLGFSTHLESGLWTRYLPGHCRNLDRHRSSIGLSPSSRPTTGSEKFSFHQWNLYGRKNRSGLEFLLIFRSSKIVKIETIAFPIIFLWISANIFWYLIKLNKSWVF